MANVQYSGLRESKSRRINDLGTTGKEIQENFRKGCLKRADRSFAQMFRKTEDLYDNL